MQRGAPSRHFNLDRQNTRGQSRQHFLFQPPPQDSALDRVTPLHEQRSPLQLLNGHHRKRAEFSRRVVRPRP